MGRTPVYRVDPRRPDEAVLSLVGAILRSGGTVAFPTETVYGLGANALDVRAVRRIFEAKGRPPDNPLIVHVSSFEEIRPLVTDIPEQARLLMETFWPGPLTILFRRSNLVPDAVTAGLDTVGIRMPDHPVALGIIRHAGIPIAAPSANLSSYPSPTRADHVVHDLDGRIDAIVDGGPTGIGVESTVLDISGEKPLILRPGYITIEDLRPFVPGVMVDPRADGVSAGDGSGPPRSPGQKYRHYSPKATVWLVEPDPKAPESPDVMAERVTRLVRSLLDDAAAAAGRIGPGGLAENHFTKGWGGLKDPPVHGISGEGDASKSRQNGEATIGILASEETERTYRREFPDGVVVATVGSREHLREVASRLFLCLRRLDDAGVDTIVAEGFRPTGLGLAIMNRLRRAADFRCLPECGSAVSEGLAGGGWAGDSRSGFERELNPSRARKVFFVCTGNTCRSPMAEGLFNHLANATWVAESAGTAAAEGEPVSPQARSVALKHGIDLSGHRSRRITSDMISRADLVLTMTTAQRDMLRKQEPSKADRIFTLKEYVGFGASPEGDVASRIGDESREGDSPRKEDVSKEGVLKKNVVWRALEALVDVGDPYGLSDEAYEETWKELERCVKALIQNLGASGV